MGSGRFRWRSVTIRVSLFVKIIGDCPRSADSVAIQWRESRYIPSRETQDVKMSAQGNLQEPSSTLRMRKA